MNLEPLFRPRSVAVVGASTRGAGATVLAGLKTLGYAGRVFAVNPRLEHLEGERCYPSLHELPEPVDVAVITLRAERCADVVADCATVGIPAAIVFASPSAVSLEGGPQIQRRLVEAASTSVACLGPNCMGFLAPAYGTGLYLDVLRRQPREGTIALITQSGSIGVGGINHTGTLALSLMASVGNEAIVTTADVVNYVIDDGATRVIALHQEGFRETAALLRAIDQARERGIRVVLCKTGRSERGAESAASHTAAVASDQRVARAVFRAHGVTVVEDVDELFAAAELLAAERRVGPRLGAFTLSGGHVGLLHDAVAETTLDFPEPGAEVRPRVERALGEPRVVLNPLDTWPSGKDVADAFSESLTALASEPAYDAFLVALDTPADPPTSPVELIRGMTAAVAQAAAADDRLWLLTTTVSGADDPAILDLLRAAQVPRLNGLRTTLNALDAIVTVNAMLEPEPVAPWWGELPTTEPETYQLLGQFGVPVTPHRVCLTLDEATRAASELGYPVVAKLIDPAVLHKSDVGGVIVDIHGRQALETAFTSISALGGEGVLVAAQAPDGVDAFVGGRVDREFGPVITVGLGGFFVELLDDSVVLPAPFAPQTIDSALARTKLGKLLDGYRGVSLDRSAFCAAAAKISRAVASLSDRPGVSVDVNPVRVHSTGAVVVDAKLEAESSLPCRQFEPSYAG